MPSGKKEPKPLYSKRQPLKANFSTLRQPSFKFGLSLASLSSIDMKRFSSYGRQAKNSRYYFPTIVFVVGALAGGFGGAWLENQTNVVSSFGGLSSRDKIITSQSQLIDQIAKNVSQSVVSINVDINSDNSNAFSQFGLTSPTTTQAAGTGIIISSSGLIVTNRHVVPQGSTNISVTLSNGVTLNNVSLVGETGPSDSLDIAFLKVNDLASQTLNPATFGDSSQVQVGDSVVAIGNALGQFQNTVTSGIISGYGRSVQAGDSNGTETSENLADLFQTDAAINEGNSGGPLVNMNGQVIAINTAIAGDAQNIGFAIPINDVSGLLKQVLTTGKFAQAYLGVFYEPLTPDIASQNHLSVTQGAYIAPSGDPANPSVISGGPADQAGLKDNDVITAVNGQAINQGHSLISLLNQYLPGTQVTLTVVRSSQTLSIKVTLGTAPNN